MREETQLETSSRDSYQCRWSLESHFEVSRSYHQSECCDDPNNIVVNKDWKVTTNPDNKTNNNFTQYDANVTNNPKNLVRYSNKLRQSLSENLHLSESQFTTHEDIKLYNTYYKLNMINEFILSPT